MPLKKVLYWAVFLLLLLPGFFAGCRSSLKPISNPASIAKVLEQKPYWDVQRKGANFFNEFENSERLLKAAELSLDWVRLTPSKWESRGSGLKKGDFLIGNPSAYDGLVRQDVNYLRDILDQAEKAHIKVVLTFLNLPAHYWSQHNDGIQDRRLWEDKGYWPVAIRFLVDVVKEFKGHKAVVGYDLINEPSPEKVNIKLKDWLSGDYQEWGQKIAYSAQDLNQFYKEALIEIRKVDPLISIIIETGYYATPWAINFLTPLKDENVLYSVHMYEPFLFTFQHRSNIAYEYPGIVPYGEIGKLQKKDKWDKNFLRDFLKPLKAWQQKHHIANNRIVIGEFGVNRFAKGAAQYFKDLIEIFDENEWHWAFYSFREDSWQIMDYELGQKKASWKYWQAIKNKSMPHYPKESNLFIDAIKNSLRSGR